MKDDKQLTLECPHCGKRSAIIGKKENVSTVTANVIIDENGICWIDKESIFIPGG